MLRSRTIPQHPRRLEAPTRSTAGIAMLIAASGLARAQDLELESVPLRWRLEAEHLDLDGSDAATQVGLHLDWLDPFDVIEGSYVGLGAFGTVWGDDRQPTRGGSFHGGLTLGWRRPLAPRWALDLGLYAGAGGGEVGDWSGGLVLRPHAGIEYALNDRLGVRLEVSHVDVPGGDIGSTQLAIGFTYLERLLSAAWGFEELQELDRAHLSEGSGRLGLGATTIHPSSRSRRDDGTRLDDDIVLAVGTLERPLGTNWFVPLEVSAAVADDVAGYAQLLAGIGYRTQIYPGQLDWRIQASIGAGGGGDVDVGGGFLAQLKTGIETPLGDDWRLRLLGGYTAAPDGDFDGLTLEAGVEWSPRPLRLAGNVDESELIGKGLFADDVDLDDWTLTLLAKNLSTDSTSRFKDGSPVNDDVQLAGVGVRRELGYSVALTLGAFGAFEGELGGYREALLGLEYELDVLEDFTDVGSFYLLGRFGAAGGAPVDLGSGVFHEFGAGWRMVPRGGFQAGLEFATHDATGGSFGGEILALTFNWSFASPRFSGR